MAGTLVDQLRRSVDAVPDSEAVADLRRTVTYAELLLEASAGAAQLDRCGVQPGDRVALVLPNSVDLAVAFYAALLAGAAAVPLSPKTPATELRSILSRCRPAAVICPGHEEHRVAAAAGAVPVVPVERLCARTGFAHVHDVALHDVACLMHTSGSTGEPRAAVLTHRAMAFTADAVAGYLATTAQDRVLSALPLSHTYGLYQLLVSVRAGAALHLRQGMTFPADLCQDVVALGITVLPGVPALWAALVNLPAFGAGAASSLTAITNAGAPMPTELVRALRAAQPAARLFLMYGQTECGRAAYLAPDLVDAVPESVGRPLAGTTATLESPDGRPVGVGEPGELVLAGPHLMEGYFDVPQDVSSRKLERRESGTVLRTGDLFTRAADGLLRFVARMDDLINAGGDKIAPFEVEQVLSTAPGIREAVVVGAPDERLGERVVAHVTAVDGIRLDERTLRRWCAAHLAPVKVPRAVVQHAELPRLPSGKVDRRRLASGL